MVVTVIDILENRGIAQAALDCDWREESYNGASGWTYPVINMGGQPYPARRWKRAVGEGQRYAWLPKKPEGVKYYLTPGAVEAIQRMGFVYLASGEPDVLAYRAAGIPETLCWFDGENAQPETFWEDMRCLNVNTVSYAPDRDETGMKAAAKLYQTKPEDMALVLNALPGKLGSKQDINDLWGMAGHDRQRFMGLLGGLEPIEGYDLEMYFEARKESYTPGPAGDGLYEQWCALIEVAAVARWNIAPPNGEGYSQKNFRSPTRQDNDPSASWNYRTHGYKDFGDVEFNTHDVARILNMQPFEDYRAGFDVVRGYHTETPVTSLTAPRPTGLGLIPPLDRSVPFMDSLRVMEYIAAELRDETAIPDIMPIKMVYEWLLQFGGFAELMYPGKLIGLVGTSGSGKTTWLEVLAETLMALLDLDVIWWSPEWSPYEMGLRTLHRAGGAQIMAMLKYQMARQEAKAGIPPQYGQGVMLSEAQMARSEQMARTIAAWPGRAHYYQRSRVPLKKLLADIRALTHMLRGDGRKPTLLITDYVQRLRTAMGDSANYAVLEDVITEIKGTCEELGLLGIVVTQVIKGDSRRAHEGKTLNQDSGQGVKDDQFNLYLTMTPEYGEGTGEKTGEITVKVVKNSLGQCGEVVVTPQLDKLRWPLKCNQPLDIP